jgi:hypothetical protein
MPIGQRYGIFSEKKAYNLALKYNLSLENKNSYIHAGNFITYNEVLFIVNNLWLDHFMYGSNKPIDVSEYSPLYRKKQSLFGEQYSVA